MGKKRDLLKKLVGTSALVSMLPNGWIRPVVNSVILPVHGQTSRTAPRFELISTFPGQTSTPNVVVQLSDDKPGIMWTHEEEAIPSFLGPVPDTYVPSYQLISSNNTQNDTSVTLEFFGGSQFTTFIRLVATDVDGNSSIFEIRYFVL